LAYNLKIPAPLASQGWKVKIRDRERLEPPHATIIRRRMAWRFGLRSMAFLDAQPDPDEVPEELIACIIDQIGKLRLWWNRMYPENPVMRAHESE
jgi:hypothetical protein